HALGRTRALEAGRYRYHSRERLLVPRNRAGHGGCAQHRRRHECLCSLRPRHLEIVQEPRRSRNRRRGRQAALQSIRCHAGHPRKISLREKRTRPDIRRLAGLAGRPGRDRRLQDRWPAAVLSRRGEEGGLSTHVVPPTTPLMIPTQRLPASLTPLDVALAALLDRLEPVAPVELPLAEALGGVAPYIPPLKAHPPYDTAAADGWALRARDLVGASSYSPLPLAKSPVWVEAGDAMPEATDCVIDSDSVDQTGPIVQALAEAIPGQGVRRSGGAHREGSLHKAAGRPLEPLDLLAL